MDRETILKLRAKAEIAAIKAQAKVEVYDEILAVDTEPVPAETTEPDETNNY